MVSGRKGSGLWARQCRNSKGKNLQGSRCATVFKRCGRASGRVGFHNVFVIGRYVRESGSWPIRWIPRTAFHPPGPSSGFCQSETATWVVTIKARFLACPLFIRSTLGSSRGTELCLRYERTDVNKRREARLRSSPVQRRTNPFVSVTAAPLAETEGRMAVDRMIGTSVGFQHIQRETPSRWTRADYPAKARLKR